MKEKKYKWYIITGIFFILLVIIAALVLDSQIEKIEVSVFGFIIMGLAVFRLIWLFTYDTIMDFIREPLSKHDTGLWGSLNELLHCPWCTGIWMALIVAILYYASSISRFFVFVIGLAGLASIILVLARYVWKKLKNENS